MAVLQVNICGDRVIDPQWPRRDIKNRLEPLLEKLPPQAPVVIYVHGHLDWPHPDVLQQAREQVGLAIIVNWPAKARFFGTLPDVNKLYQQAGNAAPALAWLINLLADLAPQRGIDLLAHSLGARVGLKALPLLAQNNLARFVGLAAVEFSAITLWALQAPAARHISFYNVTTPEAPLFHRIMHHFGPRPGPADGLLSRGFAFPRANWVDIRLDQPNVRRPLATLCDSILEKTTGLAKQPLISRLEAAFLRNRPLTDINQFRDLLGNAIPGPMSLIPVRTPANM